MEAFLAALLTTLGIIGMAKYLLTGAKQDRRAKRFGGDLQLTKHFYVADFLKSPDVKALQHYKLTPTELDNVTALALGLEKLIPGFGVPDITSGGRPQKLADFVSILREKGYKVAKHSQHNEFAAVDFTYGDVRKDHAAFQFLQDSFFHQLILTVREKGGAFTSYIHASIFDPRRPNISHLRYVDIDPPDAVYKLRDIVV